MKPGIRSSYFLPSYTLSQNTATCLLQIYDLAAWFSFFGLFVALAFVLMALLSLLFRIFSSATPSLDAKPLLVVPGISTSITEIPAILAAAAISQFLHEAGHGLAALASCVPIHGVGIKMTYLFPTAFVHLPEIANVRVSKRVIAAGPFHNAVLYILLLLLARIPFSEVVGWKDVSLGGVVVYSIDKESGLQSHLAVGELITAIDDVPVHSIKNWDQLLLSHEPRHVTSGWCISPDLFASADASCCPSHDLYDTTSNACFTPIDPPLDFHCLDSLMMQAAVKCTSSSRTCTCVHPLNSAQLMRLRKENGRDVIWRGPRQEVWHSIQVGLRRSTGWLPTWMVLYWVLFYQYLKLANISLCILNLIPVLPLDGGHLWNVHFLPHASDDVEIGTRRSNVDEEVWWKEGVPRLTFYALWAVAAMSIVDIIQISL